MKHTFTNPDLIALDEIWPVGQMLEVPENGLIIVAGSYKGRYLHYLSTMFPTARLVGFEPQVSAMTEAKKRLIKNPMVTLVPLGLGTRHGSAVIGLHGTDGASLLATEGETRRCELVDAADAFSRYATVDLLVLNMEGYEWALIPYLLDEMMHHRIKSMAIQFHPQYVSDRRAREVCGYLSEYYDTPFTNWPTWSYWKRK